MMYELTDLAVVKSALATAKKTIEEAIGFDVLVSVIPLGSPSCRTEEYLQELVCTSFGVSWKELSGKQRKGTHITNARHAYCYLNRLFFKKSLAEIGKQLSGRDHTTVINSVKQVQRWIDTNDAICHIINSVKQKMEL